MTKNNCVNFKLKRKMIYELFSAAIFQNLIVRIENWVIKDNVTYNDDENFTFGNYESEDSFDEENDEKYDIFVTDNVIEKPPTDYDFQDYKERIIKPNIEHNEKLINLFKRSKKKKRELPDDEQYAWRVKTEKQLDIAYDYEQFGSEYEQDVKEMKNKNAKLNETEFEIQQKSQCAAEKMYNKGPFTALCLLKEYYGDSGELQTNAKLSLIAILKVWGLLFLALFLIGWGHFGCLNVFCPFTTCFPDDGYEEIKQYLVLNPPGTFTRKIITKQDDNSETKIEKEHYQPTETEYYLYNKLWHSIYRQ